MSRMWTGRAPLGQRWRMLLPALLFATLPLISAAAELSGTIRISANGQALRPGEAAEAVVYFRPQAAFAKPEPLPEVTMATRRKAFIPRIMAITPGTEVRFPNMDPILHNAFSTSSGNGFDTGVYGSGDGARHRFDQPGLVRVYCNVHHSMSAHILVVDTPWFTQPDAQGNFRLSGLPDGPGDLVVFHDRTSPWQSRLSPEQQSGPLAIDLELTRRKVPPHMNKFGKPYGRSGERREY